MATAGKEIVRRIFDEAEKTMSPYHSVDVLYDFANYMAIGESRDGS
jgi:hypothetical protein